MEKALFTLGSHAAQLELLVKGQAHMQDDITDIKETLSERKGERRVILWLAGSVGTIGGIMGSMALRAAWR